MLIHDSFILILRIFIYSNANAPPDLPLLYPYSSSSSSEITIILLSPSWLSCRDALNIKSALATSAISSRLVRLPSAFSSILLNLLSKKELGITFQICIEFKTITSNIYPASSKIR